ncbi:MAG: molybdopterin-guanine dinucleotide biosynthesis protein B [Candidatus Latescibacteria bacterium]|jgi:molybdopterin-guanine dinucleotide biosynthesis protein B|nr:molybdopterin-guanine dinucleotide biosynthesis protein B [Candidatus Latescibacterota bacterium]
MTDQSVPGRENGNVPLIAVTGFRNTGKTTAIEGMVGELADRGHRVGTLKHCHGGYDLDSPGKDSWRHRRAGATRTVLTGPNGIALLGEPMPEDDLCQLAEWLFSDMDLVLAEGYHWLPLPHIDVQRSDGTTRPSHPDGEALGWLPCRFGAPQISDICDLLEQYCLPVPIREP